MKCMPCLKNTSHVFMWRKCRYGGRRSGNLFDPLARSLLMTFSSRSLSFLMCPYSCSLSLLSQASQGILSQRATGCLSQLGQTTCTLLWNTPSQRCGPSPSACGCDPLREESGLLCRTLFLSNPMNWCCCKACTPPLSCSLMTRYRISTAASPVHLNWPVHCSWCMSHISN